jgi:glycosyltransferase involved in cell wall biosynthesis
MRILQVHNEYSLPGGEDTIADAEAELLAAHGHTVERFRVRNAGSGRAAVTAFAGAAWNPRRAHEVATLATRMRADVAHLHNTWFTLSPAVVHALHDAGVPIVMTLQNYRLLCGNALLYRDGAVCTECLAGSHWRVVRHACYRGSRAESMVSAATMSVAAARGTWRLVDRFIAPSRFVRDVFVRAGYEPDRIVVRGNFAPDPGPRPSPPSRSGMVLFVGRLSVEKGADVLLSAWAAARPDGLELVVVGDGPMRAQLEAMDVPAVRFAGWRSQEEVAALLASARALVLPSQWFENFGRVVVEAMAVGLPVLASDIGTPGEVVAEVGAQWLVPPTDHERWVRALRALDDGDAVDAAGERARAAYEARFSPAVGLATLLDVYDAAIAGRLRIDGS